VAKRRAARQTFIQHSRGKTAEQKALYHQVEGAGTSRIKRPFLGLTSEEEQQVDRRIQALIDDGVNGRRS
jgi:hypothetical protein